MRGSISQSPFVSRAPYLSSWGANASDRCLPWPGYLSQKSFQCPVPSDCLRGQRVLSGSAPIKVIRVRIVALRFGVCAVTGDVSPSAPDIVPSGQSRPSSICKVLSPSKSAASPLGDARISLRRLGMSLALCPSQKSLDPLYALPRYRPLSLLTRLCPKLSMRRSEDWDRSHSQSHSGVSRCRVGVLQLCTSLANCQTGAPHYPMRESESLQSPRSSPSHRGALSYLVSDSGICLWSRHHQSHSRFRLIAVLDSGSDSDAESPIRP